MLSVKQIYTHSPLRNYTYIVYSDRSGEAVSIDPFSAEEIIGFLKKNSLKLKFILNTHEHKDHVAGNLELKEATGAKILAHKDTKGKIPGLDDVLNENDVAFAIEGETLTALDTPGHTFCHFCYVLNKGKKKDAIFTGDTLFHAGVGNCYRGGDAKTLYQTLQSKILNLPGDIKIFPGHDYIENNLNFAVHLEPNNLYLNSIRKEILEKHSEKDPFLSNLKLEKTLNPFFRLKEVFDNPKNLLLPLEQNTKETEENLFLYLRSVRDTW